jgi:hypothetical protein
MVSRPNLLLDGPHRFASRIALEEANQEKIRELTQASLTMSAVSGDTKRHDTQCRRLDSEFHRLIGFSDDDVRDLILDYSHLTKRPRYIVLFDERDVVGGEVAKQLSVRGRILDRVEIDLTQDGLFRFIHNAYELMDWFDLSLVPALVRSKTDNKNKKILYSCSVYIYEPIGDQSAHEIKLDVRAHVESLGKNGSLIHGSDNWEDTQHILDLVLSEPGRHFLNNAPYMSEASLLERLNFDDGAVRVIGLKSERVIVGSSILELYGFRRARDVDYVSHHSVARELDWGNRAGTYLGSNSILLDEALHHPRYQFRLQGRKFQSLTAYCLLQEERALTKKGRDDFRMAASLLTKEKKTLALRVRLLRRQIRWGFIMAPLGWYHQVAAWLPEFIKAPLRPILARLRKK